MGSAGKDPGRTAHGSALRRPETAAAERDDDGLCGTGLFRKQKEFAGADDDGLRGTAEHADDGGTDGSRAEAGGESYGSP